VASGAVAEAREQARRARKASAEARRGERARGEARRARRGKANEARQGERGEARRERRGKAREARRASRRGEARASDATMCMVARVSACVYMYMIRANALAKQTLWPKTIWQNFELWGSPRSFNHRESSFYSISAPQKLPAIFFFRCQSFI
jgi:hypothetical protein